MTTSLRWLEDTDWSYLKITGADRVDFLHRLTTNRVPKSGEPLVHSFLLSVNAKIIAELWVGSEEESLSLLLPTAQLTAAKENIDRYHFGEKIQVVEPLGRLFSLFDTTPEQLEQLAPLSAYAAQPDPRYGAGSLWLFIEETALEEFRAHLEKLGSPADEIDVERRRISTGRPKLGADYTEDTLFLEMAQQGDFSETKGCYPGQEIVARVLHRGRLNRSLRGFLSENVVPNSWSMSKDGKEVARVTSSVATPEGGSQGLLYVRREFAEDGTELTGSEGEGAGITLVVHPRPLEIPTGEPD